MLEIGLPADAAAAPGTFCLRIGEDGELFAFKYKISMREFTSTIRKLMPRT